PGASMSAPLCPSMVKTWRPPRKVARKATAAGPPSALIAASAGGASGGGVGRASGAGAGGASGAGTGASAGGVTGASEVELEQPAIARAETRTRLRLCFIDPMERRIGARSLPHREPALSVHGPARPARSEPAQPGERRALRRGLADLGRAHLPVGDVVQPALVEHLTDAAAGLGGRAPHPRPPPA